VAAITGTKKAALLLMAMDPHSASELLKVVKPAAATDIATEMAYLNSSGSQEAEEFSHDVVKEFSTLLSGNDQDWGLGFVKQMLDDALGMERSAKAFEEVKIRLDHRDPFAPICGTNLYELAAALEGEPTQVISLVLAELSAKESASLLGMMDDDQRNDIIRGMAGATNVSVEAKVRVAKVIQQRLCELRADGQAAGGNAQEAQMRKISVLLRGLPLETRSGMLESIKQQNEETGAMVTKMMVLWEDLPIIESRALQEALRQADPQKLAMAMVNADQKTADKIKQNMSESGRNMLYEESLLITSAKKKEIDEAREILLDDLRELNEAGMLDFETEEV